MRSIDILTPAEVQAVLLDLERKARRSQEAVVNRMIFRLSCCCGLRRCEVEGLDMRDFVLSGARPVIRIRKEATKGQAGKRKARLVPLWWDRGTFSDILAWKTKRQNEGAEAKDPFLCSIQNGSSGKRITRFSLSARWRTAIKCLGEERVEQLSMHCGRHSFCSHSYLAGHTALEIRDAVGHTSEQTTSIYLHALEQDGLGDVFPQD